LEDELALETTVELFVLSDVVEEFEGRRGEFTLGLISWRGRDVDPSKLPKKESS
jgi:hypothetical protein